MNSTKILKSTIRITIAVVLTVSFLTFGMELFTNGNGILACLMESGCESYIYHNGYTAYRITNPFFMGSAMICTMVGFLEWLYVGLMIVCGGTALFIGMSEGIWEFAFDEKKEEK